jgi:predicted TIM-barrel fold metal-dependent hydrolase
MWVDPKIDTHCHILDPKRHPYADNVTYRPAGQEVGTLDDYESVMAAYGIHHALLVGPNSGYGTDNRCLLDALQRGNARTPGRFKGIAVVDPSLATPDDLHALRQASVVGLAFNATVMGVPYYERALPLLREMAAHDMLLSLQVEHDQLAALRPMLETSGVRVMVDHCGRPSLDADLKQAGFATLLAMARNGRTAVKLSGFQKFSTQAAPWHDARPFIGALISAFTPDACLWASDWPFLRAPSRLDVGPILMAAERFVPNAADRRKLQWDTPKRWLGF